MVQSLVSRTETTATIKWSADVTADYLWFSTNNGSTWNGVNIAEGTSGSYVISGLSANTSYSVKTRVREKGTQTTSDSTALAVTTFAYPYCTSGTNFTIGGTCTINLYNPLGRSVYVVFVCADGETITNITSGTSYTGINAASSQTKLYASIPNAQSGTYSVQVIYDGNTSTKANVGTYTVNKDVCSPIIGTGAYADIRTATVEITGNNQQIVRNQSRLRATASGLAAQYSASIVSCTVEINGTTYIMAITGNTAMMTGVGVLIDSSYDVDAVFTLTDSRGLTATKTINVTVLDWYIPSAIITLARHNNFYAETDIKADANYASVDGLNVITITYSATKAGDQSPSISGTLTDNVLSTFTADNSYEWTVSVRLEDSFGGVATYNLFLSRGLPIIYFDRLKSSVGINCFPKDELSLEVNGVNAIRSVMTRSLSASETGLYPNNYTSIELDSAVSFGGKLEPTNDGGVEIGSNVSKVLVSGRVSIQGSATAGIRQLRIVKNSSADANTLAWSQQYISSNETAEIIITPTLASVSEGDVIYIMYNVPDMDDTLIGAIGARTSLTVETVG